MSSKFIIDCGDLTEDGIGGGGPAKRAWRSVVAVDVFEDGVLELGNVLKSAATDTLSG